LSMNAASICPTVGVTGAGAGVDKTSRAGFCSGVENA